MSLPGPVVDSHWLAANLADVMILDVRWYLDGRQGRDAYAAGHIPGARFVDLDVDLAAPPTAEGGRHPLPHPESFASALGRLGVGNDSTVVAYDDNGGATAARCWWMLDALGLAAAVLDGGIGSWPGSLERDEPHWEPSVFEPRPWPPGATAEIDEVAAHSETGSALILDARAAERFRGEENPIDPRFGHVPGATSAPFTANLDADGHLLDRAALSEHYEALGAAEQEVIVYCGSGVTACHDLLALRLIGIDDARLFVGSWSAWGADPSRPIELGD